VRGKCADFVAFAGDRQGGVVGRKQLLARRVPAAVIDYRVKAGRLRVIHAGVYAVGHDAIAIRGRLCAALLVAGAGRRDAELQLRGCTVVRVDALNPGVAAVARFLSRPATRTAP
jgi:hypothetical protein